MRTSPEPDLSALAEKALALYEARLRALLEPDHAGEAVAIHVDTEDNALAPTHSEAAHALLARHDRDGRIVTLAIGPPTDADLRLGARIAASKK